MDRKTCACAAFAAAFLAIGWRDAQAGAWLAAWTIALAPMAIRLMALMAPRVPRSAVTPASELEALAWDGSGSGGPQNGLFAGWPKLARRLPLPRLSPPRAPVAVAA